MWSAQKYIAQNYDKAFLLSVAVHERTALTDFIYSVKAVNDKCNVVWLSEDNVRIELDSLYAQVFYVNYKKSLTPMEVNSRSNIVQLLNDFEGNDDFTLIVDSVYQVVNTVQELSTHFNVNVHAHEQGVKGSHNYGW